jgi:hypothetical protein
MPLKEAPVNPANPNNPDPNNPNPAAPPAFDPAAFKTDLMGEITKMVQGALKAQKNDFAKLVGKTLDHNPADPANPNPDPNNPNPADANNRNPDVPADPKLSPETNAFLQKLTRELNQLKTAKAESDRIASEEKKARMENERVTAIRGVLNDIPFRTQGHRDLFFKATHADIKRDEDGAYIAEGENGPLPMKDYFKNLVETQYNDLLTPKGTGGAGATAGNSNARHAASGPVKVSDLTPEKIAKLTKPEYEAMMQNILAGNLAQ